MPRYDIDITRLYLGDYAGDTMAFTADHHAIFHRLLLQLWLQQPAILKERWLRKHSGLSRPDWNATRPLLLAALTTALAGINRWNEAISAYDGQRLPPFEWQVLRTIVLARDRNICAYCGSEDGLHADHSIPVARGGSNKLDNLVTACGPCNLSKGSKLLALWLKSTMT